MSAATTYRGAHAVFEACGELPASDAIAATVALELRAPHLPLSGADDVAAAWVCALESFAHARSDSERMRARECVRALWGATRVAP